jgi:hypothetical protein
MRPVPAGTEPTETDVDPESEFGIVHTLIGENLLTAGRLRCRTFGRGFIFDQALNSRRTSSPSASLAVSINKAHYTVVAALVEHSM